MTTKNLIFGNLKSNELPMYERALDCRNVKIPIFLSLHITLLNVIPAVSILKGTLHVWVRERELMVFVGFFPFFP